MKCTHGPFLLTSMKSFRKRGFTLLEIVISMFLLSIISSFFVYKGWELIAEHRFLSSCRQVQNELYGAKLNALSFNRDFTCRFTREGSKTILYIECVNPPKILKNRVNRKSTLANIQLEGEILFYANGFISPGDVLTCRPIKGHSKPREISLKQIDRMRVI